MGAPGAALMYMIHHVFLPPKLPRHGDDRLFGATDCALLRCASDALLSFAASVSSPTAEQDESVLTVHSMVENIIRITDDEGHLQQKLLLEALAELPIKGELPLASYSSIFPLTIWIRRASSNLPSGSERGSHRTERDGQHHL